MTKQRNLNYICGGLRTIAGPHATLADSCSPARIRFEPPACSPRIRFSAAYGVFRLLFLAISAFYICCNSDECQKNSDCNEDSYCVQGDCTRLSANMQDTVNQSSGGHSVPGATVKGTDVDTDSEHSTGGTDTSQSPLDTTYGQPLDANASELQNLQSFGCVNFVDNFYTCKLTDFVTTGMCDLINVRGCSSTLFPEACTITYTSEIDFYSSATCYSDPVGDVTVAPEYSCTQLGGKWLPCPF